MRHGESTLLTAGSATSQVKHQFSGPILQETDRGKTRARHQASVRQLRREILRSQQRLRSSAPSARRSFRSWRRCRAARAAAAARPPRGRAACVAAAGQGGRGRAAGAAGDRIRLARGGGRRGAGQGKAAAAEGGRRRRYRNGERPSRMPPSSRSRKKATTTSPTSSARAARTKRRPEFRISAAGISIGIDCRQSGRCPQGAIAQLGERVNGIHEVGGSIPPGSTNLRRFAATAWRSPKVEGGLQIVSRPRAAFVFR